MAALVRELLKKLLRRHMKKIKVLAIITARGGSKSIPRKNIADLNGKPVIAYSIEASKKSKSLTDTIISTEDKEIADTAKSYGGNVPFIRPSELAQDNTPHAPVLQHALREYEKISGIVYDYILTLQPTSPLRNSEDIDRAIRIAQEKKPDCVVSLERFTDLSLGKLKYLEGDEVVDAVASERPQEGLPRQMRKPLYRRNGAIFLTKRDVLLKGSVYGSRVLGFEMPAERSVDLNGLIDLKFAEFIISDNKF